MEMIPHCPECGELIEVPKIDFPGPFRCPACATWLSVPRTYSAAGAGAALAISCIGCYLFGLRGVLLLGAMFLGWFPASAIVIIVSLIFFPPRLRVHTDEAQSILKLR